MHCTGIKRLIHKAFNVKKTLIALSAIAALIVLAYYYAPQKTEIQVQKNTEFDKNIEIHFIDIGQGDSTLIEFPNGEIVLMDSGSFMEGEKVRHYIEDQNILKINALIASHNDADHIGAMQSLLEEFEVEKFYYNGEECNTKTCENVFRKVLDKRIEREIVKRGEINFKGFKAYALNPKQPLEFFEPNNNSIVLYLKYKEFALLIQADCEAKCEKSILDYMKPEAKILRIGHHGSRDSSSIEYLESVSPETAVISVGNNQYGHPHNETIEKLLDRNVSILRTDFNGNIYITSDGINYTVKTNAS